MPTPPTSRSTTRSSASTSSPIGRGSRATADVTTEQWESAQWQRAHTVKNLKEFKEALGDFLDDDLLADIERDQQERATMSMLIPPQMINTMEEHDLRADRVRRYMAPAPQRSPDRVDEPPDGLPRLAARGRHVGRRGPHAPLPDEGARRADPDVPAVLRSLHADGPGRQRHAAGPQVQVRDQAERPLGADARLPAEDPAGARRGRVRRRHGERADQAARGLRVEAPGHREHPRHPHRVEGPDGPAAALPAGRRPRRAGGHGDEGPLTRRRHRAAHPRELRAAGDAARGQGGAG